jgi:hypothetical protein
MFVCSQLNKKMNTHNNPQRIIPMFLVRHNLIFTYGTKPFLRSCQLRSPSKNFPAFYWTRRFITVFTRALHCSLSWARSIQFIPSYPISLRSILILSTHLRLGLPSGLFPSGFPNILHAFLFSPFGLHVLPIWSPPHTVHKSAIFPLLSVGILLWYLRYNHFPKKAP